MKRYIVLGLAIMVLLVCLLRWRGHQVAEPTSPKSVADAPAVAEISKEQPGVTNQSGERAPEHAGSTLIITNEMSDERSEELRMFNESPDLPIVFYGLVVEHNRKIR